MSYFLTLNFFVHLNPAIYIIHVHVSLEAQICIKDGSQETPKRVDNPHYHVLKNGPVVSNNFHILSKKPNQVEDVQKDVEGDQEHASSPKP